MSNSKDKIKNKFLRCFWEKPEVKYSQHWVLRPASVRGVEVAKHRIGRYSKSLDITTRWPLNAEIKTYQLAHPVTPIGQGSEGKKVPKNGSQENGERSF